MSGPSSEARTRFERFLVEVPGAPEAELTLAPDTPEDCAEILDFASEHRLVVLPWGGGTHQGIGGGVSPDLVMSTGNLLGVDWRPDDLTVVVGAGVAVADLEAQINERGQTTVLPEAPGGATVGGTVAAGASPWRRLRYGPVRDRVLEVVVATGDGRVVRGGGQVVKNVSGYDLPRLMCGSLGALGVIARVCLKLWPIGAATATVEVDDAATALAVAQRPLAVLETIEGVSVYLAGTAAEVEAQAVALGGSKRDGLHWPAPPAGAAVVSVRVPPADTGLARSWVAGLGEAVASHGVGEVVVAGDQMSEEALAEVRSAAEARGGSVVVLDGDPGIDPWGTAPATVELQRRIKTAFDPLRVLVPGRLPGGI